MQDMQQQEAEHVALHSAEAVQERRQSLAAGMLPRAFDALRNVFGTSGPVCRPQSEVKCVSLQGSHAACSLRQC